jgi:hypothetical protein
VAAPVSILRGARAFSRDQAREAMAPGYLWDVVDYVPMMIDSPLTGRGAWIWGSDASAGADFNSGILAPYTTGEQNLANSAGTICQVSSTAPYPITNRGAGPATVKQNPVMLFDQVVWFDGAGAQTPTLVPPTGAPTPIAAANCPKATLGSVWGEFLIAANQPGHEDTIYFSPPDDVTQPWDPNSFWRTAGVVTGVAALRTVILVFHPASIERLRGTRPPAGTSLGDMVLEPLFQQVGTTEPRTICYWQENVLFADEHGVHITDGAVLRNLVQQGSISTYWRNLYNHKQSLSATVFLDYYIVSVIRTDGIVDALVCDLNARQWFRFSNIAAVSMWASGGTVGMERIWGGMNGTHRLGRLSPCFFPMPGGALIQDANGVNVLPYLETAYYKLSAEGRKRIRFAYLSYDARASGGLASDQPAAWEARFRSEETEVGPAPAAAGDPLQLAYIVSPNDTNWTTAGTLPMTGAYTRYRLPVGKAPYGIAFQLQQLNPTSVTRLSDLALDVHPIERSRL